MGAHSRLDTEITVKLDTSELDEWISYLQTDKNFNGTGVAEMQALKKGYEKASKESAKTLARRDKSYQAEMIYEHCNHPTGMLASSIRDERRTDYSYLIGTTINHIYPLCVEFGRRGFSAKNGGVLVFWSYEHESIKSPGYDGTGGYVYTKRVGKAEPRPYVEPAYREVLQDVDNVVDYNLGRFLNR